MQMYFIAIVLPAHLNEKVLKYKQVMLEKYNCKVGLKSPAHITLIPPFWMDEQKEEQLIKDLTSLSTGFQPFQLVTNNFSAFKPKTIFVALAENKKLSEIKETTDLFFRSNSFYSIKTDTRPYHPHITIATRDLFKKSFHEIWPWFEEKNFLEEFTVEGISLLRHNKKNWDVIFTSQFSYQ